MKRILLALDCSLHSRQAATYVAAVAGRCPDLEVALLTVLKGIPYGPEEMTELLDGPGEAAELHGDEDPQVELDQARAFVAQVAEDLERAGIAAENITTTFRPLTRGVALDILDEALARGCDTVAVGRQSHSRFGELLAASVSSELIRHAEGLTVWVVG